MRHRSYLCLSVALVFGLSNQAALGGSITDDEEQTLQTAGLTTDGPTLLEFFQARSRTDANGGELQELVRKLEQADAEKRIEATAAIVSLGPLAIPALRPMVNNPDDPMLAERAKRCLAWLHGPRSETLAIAAARLLAVRKPPGAAGALLKYLPFAESPAVAQEITIALGEVAFHGAKPDPAIIRGVADPVALRRGAACIALCKANEPAQLPTVRNLLRDPSPTVRLKAALALADAHDASGVPVLIDLLAELGAEARRPAEEFLQQLAGEWAPALGFRGEDEVARRTRRDAWAAWWRNADGPNLLTMVRMRTLTSDDKAKVRALIAKLGDASFEVREKATAELIAVGTKALPLLREATKSGDLEISRRAEACIRGVQNDPSHHLPSAAVRLLTLRRPEGAAEALLAYLPFAQDEAIADEVHTTLASLVTAEGKPEPAFLRALNDVDPVIRAAAGMALTSHGGPEARPAVLKLLKDRDPIVRMHVARALSRAGEREAVVILIDLLGTLPAEPADLVQDFLFQLAGEKAPPTPAPDADANARKKYQDAWAAWWKEEGGKIDLAKLAAAPNYLGLTIILEVQNNNVGRVAELSRDGKVRWAVDGFQYPVDAWVLPGNRVLVAEYNGRKVTERDLKGKVIWEKGGFTAVVNVQRMPNGNTFIASDSQMVEVDRTGRQIYAVNNVGGITAACKARSGTIICLLNTGRCVRYDNTGKELGSFMTGRGGGWTSGIDALANGHVLIADPNRGKVVEYSLDGKTIHEFEAPQVTTASGLPNGNILAASYGTRRAFEVDRKDKVVWEYKSPAGAIFRARRR